MKLSFALFFCMALSEIVSVAQLGVPQPGVARFADRSLRIVRGIPANLIVGRTPVGTAAAASFSDSGGMIAENGKIKLLNARAAVIAEYECADPAPILNVDGPLSTALAWLPTQRTILSWSGTSFSTTSLQAAVLDGQVSAIRRITPEIAELLLVHPDGTVSELTVSLKTGNIFSEDYLPSTHGRTFFQHGWLVSLTPNGLSVDGTSHQEFQLSNKRLAAEDLTIERMSTDWLHISSASTGQDWALYLSVRDMSLSWLPAVRVSQ